MEVKDMEKPLKDEEIKKVVKETTKKKYVVLQNNTDYAGVLYQTWDTILLDNNTWFEKLFKLI